MSRPLAQPPFEVRLNRGVINTVGRRTPLNVKFGSTYAFHVCNPIEYPVFLSTLSKLSENDSLLAGNVIPGGSTAISHGLLTFEVTKDRPFLYLYRVGDASPIAMIRGVEVGPYTKTVGTYNPNVFEILV